MRRKKLTWSLVILLFLLVMLIFLIYDFGGVRKTASIPDDELSDRIKLPEGFSISVFAEDLGSSIVSYPGPNVGPRFMAYYDDILLVALIKAGSVVALPDADRDGIADAVIVVTENLRNPNSLQVHDDELYIAQEDQVIKGSLDENLKLQNIEIIIDELPAGKGHFTRTILIHDSSLYLSIGSSCNVCEESDPRRASVMKCTLDGHCQVFASGLRNSVGLTIGPENQIWSTDNGRDWLGNELPPEELNIITEGNYGWPICYGNRIHDTDFDDKTYIRNPCEDTIAPVWEMQAHTAPLGLTFYGADQFPPEFRDDLFVAYHGSWNRDPATGYKVVRIRMRDGKPRDIEDFASGWLDASNVFGRPVDVVVAPDGSLMVSDDNQGKIYKITYQD